MREVRVGDRLQGLSTDQMAVVTSIEGDVCFIQYDKGVKLKCKLRHVYNYYEFKGRKKKAKKIWTCKVGECNPGDLPRGADSSMREAVSKAYLEITGKEPVFLFSGWDGELDDGERDVVNYDSDGKRREEEG